MHRNKMIGNNKEQKRLKKYVAVRAEEDTTVKEKCHLMR
jgi:hypothetical protein